MILKPTIIQRAGILEDGGTWAHRGRVAVHVGVAWDEGAGGWQLARLATAQTAPATDYFRR